MLIMEDKRMLKEAIQKYSINKIEELIDDDKVFLITKDLKLAKFLHLDSIITKEKLMEGANEENE